MNGYYDVVIEDATGQHSPIYQDIHGEEEAIERAEKWFNENVKGRFKGKIMVTQNEPVIVRTFEEKNPEGHESEPKDVGFEDFFKKEEEDE